MALAPKGIPSEPRSDTLRGSPEVGRHLGGEALKSVPSRDRWQPERLPRITDHFTDQNDPTCIKPEKCVSIKSEG